MKAHITYLEIYPQHSPSCRPWSDGLTGDLQPCSGMTSEVENLSPSRNNAVLLLNLEQLVGAPGDVPSCLHNMTPRVVDLMHCQESGNTQYFYHDSQLSTNLGFLEENILQHPTGSGHTAPHAPGTSITGSMRRGHSSIGA